MPYKPIDSEEEYQRRKALLEEHRERGREALRDVLLEPVKHVVTGVVTGAASAVTGRLKPHK